MAAVQQHEGMSNASRFEALQWVFTAYNLHSQSCNYPRHQYQQLFSSCSCLESCLYSGTKSFRFCTEIYEPFLVC